MELFTYIYKRTVLSIQEFCTLHNTDAVRIILNEFCMKSVNFIRVVFYSDLNPFRRSRLAQWYSSRLWAG
jgi:hypothetical protein